MAQAQKTLELSGRKYRITELPAIQQQYLLLKLSPAVAGFFGGEEGKSTGDFIKQATGYLSSLSFADYNAILQMLLSTCEVSAGHDTSWSSLYAGDTLAYQDITLADMMIRLVPAALTLNYSPFFKELGSRFPTTLAAPMKAT